MARKPAATPAENAGKAADKTPDATPDTDAEQPDYKALYEQAQADLAALQDAQAASQDVAQAEEIAAEEIAVEDAIRLTGAKARMRVCVDEDEKIFVSKTVAAKPEHVLAHSLRDGRVTVVTRDGRKYRAEVNAA